MSDTPVNPFDDAEEIAKKSMVLFFLIDCSGSMGGSKIGTVNSVMEELIPEIRGIGGADADIKLAVLKFSGGCEWMYDEPISIDEFEWKPLDAENVTDLGSALTELAAKLSRNEFMKSPSLSFAPVMILMSDGYPVEEPLVFQRHKGRGRHRRGRRPRYTRAVHRRPGQRCYGAQRRSPREADKVRCGDFLADRKPQRSPCGVRGGYAHKAAVRGGADTRVRRQRRDKR